MNKKKKIGITLIAFAIVLLSVVGSYAFFTSAINNENKTTAELNTATLSLTFADNDNGINERLMFGESVTKKFTITNTGTRDASLSLDWHNLVNTYMNGSLSYNLTYATSETGEYQELILETNMPISLSPLNQTLAGELSVPAGETYYYNLKITLNNLDEVNQTPDKDAVFHTKFSVGQPLKYRYYTLTVDPNGGTWGEFTAPQEYLLKNNETMDIVETPTRTGYTFDKWELKGVSSELTNTTFTMGISDAILTAKWRVNQYELTIDANGGTYEGEATVLVDYNGTVTVKNPTRKGYTFTGWNVVGGRVENNTFTLTEPNNASLTATWQINNYKYIIYHNQMNVSGEGYTLVGADTDEGENYPPTKNVINYNYDRNKYYLTINNNNGTENIVQEMYYQASTTLNVPTKTGYSFTSWTATGGTLNENIFTINASDAEVTANYTPKEYSVTFNANGGTVDTPSKTVTYNSTFGTLPVPTYNNYKFLGWFTDAKDGVQIAESTKVNIIEDQTLYAHWLALGSEVTLANLGVTPKAGNPNFATAAITNEGIYSMADDYGTSYYYRGAVTNNYVKFANMFWRIIRVNGDGSIRMIYDGKQAYNNGVNNTDRVAMTSIPWNANYNDAKYVGWMFGGIDGVASTSKEQAQTNETDSDIKEKIDKWYIDNIETLGYGKYVSDAIFCNDRSTPGTTKTNWSIDTAKGFSNYVTGYGALSRFLTGNNSANLMEKLDPSPQFVCSQKNDAFTVDDEIKGNGDLNHSVGLITADEIVAAGSGRYVSKNSSFYLYKGMWYWSMSPADMYPGSTAYMFVIRAEGNFNDGITNYESAGVAPVINLSPEVSANLVGEGTMNVPFELPA